MANLFNCPPNRGKATDRGNGKGRPRGFRASDSHASLAVGVSAHGNVVVGTIRTQDGNGGFRWTEPGGRALLGDLPDIEFPNVWPADVSADGSVVVGNSQRFIRPRCFRWTSATGRVEPTRMPGARHCQVRSVSADGSASVGTYELANEDYEFFWEPTRDLRDLRDLRDAMVEAGLGPEIEGWRFLGAAAIAADNETLVGWGENPQGAREAFLVRLGQPGPPSGLEIPTMSHAALVVFAGLLIVSAVRALRRS